MGLAQGRSDRFPLFIPGNHPCDQSVGRNAVFADIDYWAGTLVVEKVEAKITEKTRAIVACNNNGHPARGLPLRAVAESKWPDLIEDSTEAIGSRYQGRWWDVRRRRHL